LTPYYSDHHYTATLCYTSPHFTQLHFTTLIDASRPLVYPSLPFHLAFGIYISCRSTRHITSHHITLYHITWLHITLHHIPSLDTVQISSKLFPKNKPLHCPKKLFTISLHLNFYFILFYLFICLLILSTLHFTSPSYF
jgi:hypothetical protein